MYKNPKEYELNYEKVEGNRTNAELYKAYQKILTLEGKDYDFKKMRAERINEIVGDMFAEQDINPSLLIFDSNIEGNDFDKQAIMQLWHLLQRKNLKIEF